MTHLRGLLAIIGGGALGVLAAELILGLGVHDAAVCIAVAAACVIGIHLVAALQKDSRQAGKGRQAWNQALEHLNSDDGRWRR